MIWDFDGSGVASSNTMIGIWASNRAMDSLLYVYFTHQMDQTLFLVADIHSIVVIDRVNESHGAEKEKPLSIMLENGLVVNSASLKVAFSTGDSQIIHIPGSSSSLFLDVIQRQVVIGATEVASWTITSGDALHLIALLVGVWWHGFPRP
jgi:hypothetical protein